MEPAPSGRHGLVPGLAALPEVRAGPEPGKHRPSQQSQLRAGRDGENERTIKTYSSETVIIFFTNKIKPQEDYKVLNFVIRNLF